MRDKFNKDRTVFPEEEPSKPGDKRAPGPAPALAVRSFGDPDLAEVLATALAATGRVDRATHGFHAYPANMHPDAAAAIIAACPGPIFDPFCGGGTVLVEALLAGRPTAGADLSPIAVLVARARTAGPEAAGPLRAAARKVADRGKATRTALTEIPDVAVSWYEPHVAQELGRLRDGIREAAPAVQPLLWAVLSSIAIKVSFRDSDTRNAKTPTHRPPGTTTILFHKKARELGRALETLPAGASAIVKKADATRAAPPPETGLLLTSPPYPGVYDYLPMQQLRYAWLGIEPGSALAGEVGSRRSFRALGRAAALARWRDDTDQWVACQAGALRRGARMAIVVGDGFVGDKLVDALHPTVEAMKLAGLDILARASADRLDHAREVIRIEHFVLGERR